MREILFRGQTGFERKWIEGYYSKEPSDDGSIDVIVQDTGEWNEIYPEPLCEFTGLYDKNGTKIFEGDIVKLPLSERNCKVVFKSGCFVAEYGSQGLTVNNSLYGGDVEVIGNIYDNPELLEENK